MTRTRITSRRSATQDCCVRMSWFGEIPLQLEELDSLTRDATIVTAIGTSGQVYPAANFVNVARSLGARCIEFNLEASGVFDEFVPGLAAQTVTSWVDALLGGNS